MKFQYLSFFVCIFLSCISNIQLGAQINNAKFLTLDELKSDFDVLRKSLEEAHGGLYRFSNKDTLNWHFDNYRKKLNNVKNQLEFITILSEMLSEIRDGHMNLEYDEATRTSLAQARLFPFRVAIEGRRLKVMYNDTPNDSTILPGMEILSINGQKSLDLIQLILPKMSGDGYIETGKMRRLERNFGQNYWLFVDQSADFIVTATDAWGKIKTTKLVGVPNAERINNRNTNSVNKQILSNVTKLEGPKENISLQFVNGLGIASLRIRLFDGQNFLAEIDSAFRTLNEKKSKALILDLRGNGGGVDTYGASLVSYFTNKPFRYFDRIHLKTISPSFATWKPGTFEDLRNSVVPDPNGGYLVTTKLHTGISQQNPATKPFLGKVFVLLDGGTFSTAADVTAILRNLSDAVFIGEESGGTYEGNTSGLNALIKLPNSKLSLKIHMYGYWNAVSQLAKGRGTLPNYFVEKRIIDLLKGNDMQLSRAIELATVRTTALR